MILYLVRHGEALSELLDFKRPLTENGRRQVNELAQLLKKKKVRIDKVCHSSLLRAQETAQLLKESLGLVNEVERIDGLLPNDTDNYIGKTISEFERSHPLGALMLVGHLPFLPKLAQKLLNSDQKQQSLDLDVAGLLCLNYAHERGWFLEWKSSPRDLL